MPLSRAALVLCWSLLVPLVTAQGDASKVAALPEPPPAPSPQHHKELRQALCAEIGDGIALLRGLGRVADMGPFHQSQDFFYLSGIDQPDVEMILGRRPDGTVVDELLVPPFSPFTARWEGSRLAPGENAARRTGFATVGNERKLQDRLDELLAADERGKRPVLWLCLGPAVPAGGTPGQAAGVAGQQNEDRLDGRVSRELVLRDRLAARYPGVEVRDLSPVLHRMRARKAPAEIAILRASAELAAEGIAEAMRSTRPGVFEFQIAAVARYVFSLRGAGPDAYGAIVGAGGNGCVLHYMTNDSRVADGDLIVMDYAATLHGYAADVTRTFPANGRYTAAQRKLVQDVYDIQQALIAMVKPGARLSSIGQQCSKMLTEKGYTPRHGPCHHVGLAVHDPGGDLLEPGMVITVEPGAYLDDQAMGCRIEDTLLVTPDGHENLSSRVPSAPDAVEAWMRGRGVLALPVGIPR